MTLDSGDGGTTATFRLDPGFIGFQGHFPSRPVLPGACQLQCLLVMVESLLGKELALKEIVLAKYAVPVGPGDELVCRLDAPLSPEGGEQTVRARLSRDGVRVTELKVRVGARSPGGEGE
jgi:3-hydroxymyristoyl/3-hydroxydecanoyl-(acyl carrier protein) dehydratase